MLVGTTNVNVDDIVKRKNSEEELMEFVESLIPHKLKHNEGVRYNTMYYCNYLVQGSSKFTLEEKKNIANILTRRIHIVGVLDNFFSLDDIANFISWNKVNKYLEGDRNGKSL